MTRRIVLALLVAAATVLVLVDPFPAWAAEGGLNIFPDFDPASPTTWWSSPMIHLIILFVLLMYPANKLVFGPLLATLDERGKRIEGARAEAERVGTEANVVLGRYEHAVREARIEADGLRKEQLDEGKREQSRLTAEARGAAEDELGRVRREVASALDAARGDLRTQAQDLAGEAAARVLGRSLS